EYLLRVGVARDIGHSQLESIGLPFIPAVRDLFSIARDRRFLGKRRLPLLLPGAGRRDSALRTGNEIVHRQVARLPIWIGDVAAVGIHASFVVSVLTGPYQRRSLPQALCVACRVEMRASYSNSFLLIRVLAHDLFV